MGEPTEAQRQFIREILDGDRCAICGDLHEAEYDCEGAKRALIDAVFPELRNAENDH